MMKVDFYVLEVAEQQRVLLYSCKLLEKAHAEKQKVYVHTQSQQDAERLDKLLWTYREDSFIPHELAPSASKMPAPIQIGFADTPKLNETLLNLAHDVPDFYAQFNHIIEIVFTNETAQQLARERFKFYRSNNCDITQHCFRSCCCNN